MRIAIAILAAISLPGCPAPQNLSENASPLSSPPPEEVPVLPERIIQPADYHGVWSTKDDKEEHFDIVIFSNGQAVTTWAKGTAGARGERGYWRMDGNILVIFYNDGWTDMLRPEGEEFRHEGFSPGTPLSQSPSNSAPAVKAEGILAEFTGIWRLNKEPDGNYLYIALLSNGRALSTINAGTEGKWEIQDKSAICYWPDGWTDILERGGNGYQKRSWVGNAPTENTPADVSPAVRVGETKFIVSP